MRRTTRLLLLLLGGLPVVACFDFGKYSFPEGGEAVGAAGSQGQPTIRFARDYVDCVRTR
jgi:hypothetical protein